MLIIFIFIDKKRYLSLYYKDANYGKTTILTKQLIQIFFLTKQFNRLTYRKI